MRIGSQLLNKNILFFSVQTFDLEKEIKRKLESFGASVYYFDERPANNNFSKGIIRIKRSLYQKKIDAYYKAILEKTKSVAFDYLFVNRGEVVPAFFLEELRLQQPDCIFLFYTWDSFTNHHHPTTILKYFDRKATFDPKDAIKYDIGFRPLFYLDRYKNITVDSSEYDVLFLGTAHSDRYRISSAVSKWAEQKGLRMFSYYYMHGRLVYFYKRLFDKTFKQFDYRKLSFTSLKTDQIVKLYQQSKVILDINHPNQNGLTMRTFEAIGAKRKMITTNGEVVKFPFYNENNVCLIDRNDIVLKDEFFRSEYQPLDDELYEKLSIEGWLYNVFLNGEESFWNSYR